MVLFAVFLVGLFAFSDGYIWERFSSKPKEKNLQEIPSVAKTAETIETNFLKRNKRPVVAKPQRIQKRGYEVVLLVDCSGSIEIDDFQMGLTGLQELLDRLKSQTNVAAVTFSTQAHVQFPFVSIAEAKRRIKTIHHQGKKTNTLQALKEARALFANATNGLPWQPHVRKQIFMVTDGKPNAEGNTRLNLILEATRVKFMGVEIFVLLIGDNVDGVERIATIATSTKRHFYRVHNSTDFVRVVKLIQKHSEVDPKIIETGAKRPEE